MRIERIYHSVKVFTPFFGRMLKPRQFMLVPPPVDGCDLSCACDTAYHCDASRKFPILKRAYIFGELKTKVMKYGPRKSQAHEWGEIFGQVRQGVVIPGPIHEKPGGCPCPIMGDQIDVLPRACRAQELARVFS